MSEANNQPQGGERERRLQEQRARLTEAMRRDVATFNRIVKGNQADAKRPGAK